MKENDWLLNNITNPEFSVLDFKSVGLDATNTSLEDADKYKDIPEILNNAIFQTEGKFDEVKFDNYYKYLATTYNQLAEDTYNKDVVLQEMFHRDNIFVNDGLKRKGPDIVITKEANPIRRRRGIKKLGFLDDLHLSVDEAAQTQRVLVNPVEYEKGAEAIYHESPNDSWFTDFFDTRVMAQWDKDGTHIDPISKQEIKHAKGDFKINENGSYYYENLEGRDIYGRKVLSKLNHITKDGSDFNKYDFFDSDDIEKSTEGTIARNAITILPMLIPGISPWYIGARVALSTSKILSTLGKVFTGSDNQLLSTIEGFSSSMDSTTSDYGQNNAWSMENFVNLAGQVFSQLYEQRWLFKYAPAAFNGFKPMTEETKNALMADKLAELLTLSKYAKLTPTQRSQLGKTWMSILSVAQSNATNAVEEAVKQYNNLGKIISQAYMTGITVQDAYGEAKANGLSDIEASLLTLGYAVGEYGIINSQLGNWILPELRMEKLEMKLVFKTLMSDISKVDNTNIDKLAKSTFAKKIFNIGKKWANGTYSLGSPIKSTAASALGEGIEEVSEELLYDFSKSVMNLGMWLAGSESKPLTAWDNMLDRYGMSFVGGAIGGAMFDFVPNYREAKSLLNMTYDEAYLKLIYMGRNGEMNKFLRTADKMEIGQKYLSTELTTGIDGIKTFKQGTDDNNQDLAAKKLLHKLCDFIMGTLNANGAKSDNELLDDLTFKDLRFAALKESTVARKYLLDYNSLHVQIIDKLNEINNLATPAEKAANGEPTDKQKREGAENTNKETINKLNLELRDLIAKRDAYANNEMSPRFVKEALFEMSEAVSGAYMSPTLIQYVENNTKRKFNSLSKKEISEWEDKYKAYKDTDKADMISLALDMHEGIAKKSKSLFDTHVLKYYDSFQDSNNKEIQVFNNTINSLLTAYSKEPNVDTILNGIQLDTNNKMAFAIRLYAQKYGEEHTVELMQKLEQSKTDETIIPDLEEELIDFLDTYVEEVANEFINLGYINPIAKELLVRLLDTVSFFHLNKSLQVTDENEVAKHAKFNLLYDKVTSLKHSNVTELLDQFTISSTDSEITASKLLQDALSQLLNTSSDISNFTLKNDTINDIKELLNIIKVLKAQILSARVDSVDVDNIFGMNQTYNELNSKIKTTGTEEELPIIELNIADAMLLDLEMIELKLNYFKTIIYANNAQTFIEQDRTANNKNVLTYNKLKNLFINVPDDWSEKLKINSLINSFTAIPQLIEAGGSVKVKNDLQKQIDLEIIQLDDAIYDFFAANADKVKNKEELAKFINVNNFSVISDKNLILNSESNDLDDSAIIWYIAARAAVRASDFYYMYRNIINDEIAPLPTQEMATYLGYASIVNGGMIDNFCNAINYSLKEYGDSHTLNDIKSEYPEVNAVEPEFILDSSASPRFSRVVLIEGIAGSGKTTAVFNNISQLLKKYHPSLLEKAWVAHTSKSNADNLITTLGFKDATGLSREDLMSRISQSWKAIESYLTKRGEELGFTSTDVKDEQYYDVGSDVEFDENNIVHSTFPINEISEVPSIIFIDEISKYSVLDLDLINKFAKKYDIPIIVAGDFDQSSNVGKHTIDYKGLKVTNKIELGRHNFINSFKLGVSMRAENNLVAFNQNQMQHQLPNLISGKGNKYYETHYYEDETGIYGTKTYDFGDGDYMPFLKADIDKMIATLKPNKDGVKEKIGVIYYDDDSPVYKLLSESTHSDLFEFKKGSSAQGMESLYYIIDDSGKLSEEDYWHDIYTFITRARKGSVWIHADLGGYRLHMEELRSSVDTSTTVKELNKEAIKLFSEKRRAILNSIDLESAKVPKIIKRGKESSIITLTITEDNPDGLQSTIVITEESKEEIITNNGLPSESEMQNRTQVSNEDKIKLPEPKILSEHISSDEVKEVLNLLMYSFNTFETGTDFFDSELVIEPLNKGRIDSYFGIHNLFEKTILDESIRNKKQNTVTYDDTIGKIRSIVKFTPDKGEMIKKLQSLLNLKGKDVYVTFGIKQSVANDNADWGRFYKDSSKEKCKYTYDETPSQVNNRTLSVVIGQDGEDLLELPILTFPNPDSLLNNPIFELVKKLFSEIKLKYPKAYTKELYELLSLELANHSEIPGYFTLSNFITLYTITDRVWFRIDDDSWTPSKDLVALGPSVINKVKGTNYNYTDAFIYDGRWITLKELSANKDVSISNIKISPKGNYEFNGRSIHFVEAGHPFIFYSDDVTLRLDELENYYYELLKDPDLVKKVKIIKVVPPKVSVDEYFENLVYVMASRDAAEKAKIRLIGNQFTPYRILDKLFQMPGYEADNNPLKYNDDAYPGVLKLVNDLNALEGNIQKLMDLLNSPSHIVGINSDLNNKQALLDYLLSIVYLPGPHTRVFNAENLQAIKDLLLKFNIDGIFVNVKYDKNSGGAIVKDALYDKDAMSIYGQPFMVNGKVTSSNFYGNMAPVINSILSKIVYNRGRATSKDNNSYRALHSKIGRINVPSTQVQLNNLHIKASDSSVFDLFNPEDLLNMDLNTILQTIENDNRFIIEFNGKYYISKKSDKYNPTTILIDRNSIESIGQNLLNMHVRFEDNWYDAIFVVDSSDTPTLSLSKANISDNANVLEPVYNLQETLINLGKGDPNSSIDILTNAFDDTDYDVFSPLLGLVMNPSILIEEKIPTIVNYVNNMTVTDNVIGEISDALNDEDSYEKDSTEYKIVKHLMEFLLLKLLYNKNKSVNECSTNIITIKF